MKKLDSKCVFCSSLIFTPINDGKRYCGIEISLSSVGTLRSRNFDADDNLIGQEIININFCPVCGRKLK